MKKFAVDTLHQARLSVVQVITSYSSLFVCEHFKEQGKSL